MNYKQIVEKHMKDSGISKLISDAVIADMESDEKIAEIFSQEASDNIMSDILSMKIKLATDRTARKWLKENYPDAWRRAYKSGA